MQGEYPRSLKHFVTLDLSKNCNYFDNVTLHTCAKQMVLTRENTGRS